MKCFVDTTVLTDALLGNKATREIAKQALNRFTGKLVPEYAHKEFKGGPLKNFFWLYTKFATTKSFLASMNGIQRLSRTPQSYKTSTGIQAYIVAAEKLIGLPAVGFGNISAKEVDKRMARMYELELKRIIISSWNNRNKIGQLFEPLDCYPAMQIDAVAEPFTIKPDNCPKGKECCLKKHLVTRGPELQALRDALNAAPSKRENAKRNNALKQLQKKPNEFFGRELCRDLGDAYFVLNCPSSCSILTTNRNDFPTLAAAVGKTVSYP
jgi:hypothetical protein